MTFSPLNGQAISGNIWEGGGGGSCPLPPFKILIIAYFTYCLLLTYRLIPALPEYKLKVENICEMHGTGGIKVLVLCAYFDQLMKKCYNFFIRQYNDFKSKSQV